MRILKRLDYFFSLEQHMMFLLLEAYIYLAWARVLLKLPFSKVAPYLGCQMQETPTSYINPDKAVLQQISDAIGIMSNHTFWESKCLVKAIAGMKMLARRRIESTLYLGTAKDEEGELIAHAWLRSGQFYISGADVKKRFTIVGKFAKKFSN